MSNTRLWPPKAGASLFCGDVWDAAPLEKELLMQADIIPRKPLRHWLNALAIAGTDQTRHIKWTHLTPRFVTQAIQKRSEPVSKLISPIRRRACHGRPSKCRPPMRHRKTDLGIPDRLSMTKICQSSASVLILKFLCSCFMIADC